jgi:hypothetical protein
MLKYVAVMGEFLASMFFFEKIRKLDLICFRFSPYKSDFGSNVMVLLQLV